MREFDVIVIGAGPAGLHAAKILAEGNAKVLCIDKKQEIGVPKRCGEGLGLGWMKRLGLKPDRKWCLQPITGAALYSPSLKSIEIDDKKTSGYVIERRVFEKELAKEAAKKGALIRTKCRAFNFERKEGKVIVSCIEQGEHTQYSAPIIIAADGTESLAARRLGLDTKISLNDIDSGYQYEMANISFENPHFINLFFGKNVAPRGYCLTADSEIFLRHSIKPIADLGNCEDVLTLEGWHPVVAKSWRQYDGQVVKVKPFMLDQTVGLTEEHLIYIWNAKGGFSWKKAKDLKKSKRGSHMDGDYLVFPIPQEDSLEFIDVPEHYKKGIVEKGFVYPAGRNQFGAKFKYKHKIPQKLFLSEELLELMGFFIAEGNTNSNGIILSNTKKELIDKFARIGEEAFGFKGSVWVQKRKGFSDCHQLHFASVILKKMFADLFGVGCPNKKIPPEFLGLDESKKIALLKGLFLGDGNIEKSSEGLDKLNYTTVSKHLVYDIWMLLSTINIVGAIGKIKKKNAYRIRIRGPQLKKLNGIFRKLNTGSRKHRGFFIDGNKVMLGINSLKKEDFSGKVFDIQANGSFCAGGFLVHNCWIFPKSKTCANVGIGIAGTSQKTAKEYLDKFVQAHPGLRNGSIIEVNAGTIPVGGFLEEMTADNLIVVGDAAHQVNPIHGGGIGIAMEAATIASKVALEALKKKDFSQNFLSKYSKIWYETRGNKLKKILKQRHMFEALDDDNFETLAESITGQDLMLIAEGDLAASAKMVITKLVKHPKLAGIMLKYLK